MGNISPTLAVRDMKATIAFYKETLGFKMGLAFPDATSPEYVDLSKDGMVLMFIPAKNAGLRSREKLGVGVNLYMQIDGDIDQYYKKLKRKDVKITADIKDEPFGIRDFTIEDINGYKLTFNQVRRASTICMSCGMPMLKPEDHGAGKPSSLYCVHCFNSDGSLKTYEEVCQGMTAFMIMSQKMDRATAKRSAKEYMAKMPAWSNLKN
jgi:uncharacterized glyoxalase superfamily protein PhnB